MSAARRSSQRPVVFLGPSMALKEASEIVDADFRPPCRRGDLTTIPGGALVGLVDGVFDQHDAVSPREIVYALERGVTILGSSSMGALRGAEVPGIQGIGRIYQMYRQGTIDEDDEVALLFDPKTFAPSTVPLVNIRHAVERLQQSGTIASLVASRIVDAARKLHYTQRTYQKILQRVGIGNKSDTDDLLNLLESFDLKRDDARLLLERLSDLTQTDTATATPVVSAVRPDYGAPDSFSSKTVGRKMNFDAPVHVWETGDTVPFEDLVVFLKLTGKFEVHASSAITLLFAGGDAGVGRKGPLHAKQDFRTLCDAWGWRTNEEQRVTLTDLGLPVKDVLGDLAARRRLRDVFATCARTSSEPFLRALRCELFANDMALKRETMRCGSLRVLGSINGSEGDVDNETVAMLCRLHGTHDWGRLQRRLHDLGVDESSVQKFASSLRSARENAKAILSPAVIVREFGTQDRTFGLRPSIKPPGTDRFSISMAEAYAEALRLKDTVGVTRVGMIAGLAELDGVHVSQAARPSGAWSSSYGSGKSDSKEGAVTGGVMEEVEKWAQERFEGQRIDCSFSELQQSGDAVIDPRCLDLPHDSSFHDDTSLPWHQCTDLIQGSCVWIPLAAIACPFHARKNNPFYSARGARVVFSTNGLASGFTLVEAMVHAVCECIERHATRICELQMENPGLNHYRSRLRRIDLQTVPEQTRSVIEQLRNAKCDVSAWDITSRIRVPTMMVRLIRDFRVAQGWATHPNPAVAVHMALLEACQTLASQVAAGREDLSVEARSLGRHERTRPSRRFADSFWQNQDKPGACLAEVEGLAANDIYDEFVWVRQRLAEAGAKHLIAVNLSRPEITPAHVVRVVIPGLETTNPFYCGPRARLALVSDLVPLDSQFDLV